ncbi:MAG: hypothetical protein ABFS56_33370 [Pseudomonadota bacterium]
MEYVTSIEKRGIEKGRLDGQRVIVENLLQSRFGGLDDRLADVIEPLLQLSPDESSRLLLQSSREELLARFLH